MLLGQIGISYCCCFRGSPRSPIWTQFEKTCFFWTDSLEGKIKNNMLWGKMKKRQNNSHYEAILTQIMSMESNEKNYSNLVLKICKKYVTKSSKIMFFSNRVCRVRGICGICTSYAAYAPHMRHMHLICGICTCICRICTSYAAYAPRTRRA